MNNAPCYKRIKKELAQFIDADEEQKFSVHCEGDDLRICSGIMMGPEDTPYVGGVFFLTIEFPTEYPFKPPKVKFQTKIYHMNITEKGEICLPMLKDNWSPALNICKVLEAIHDLLIEPNLDSPQRADVGEQYNNDRKEHDKQATEWTAKYAT